jgi:hypothetical protein
VSDPNKQLMDLLEIPADAVSATLRMRPGTWPTLTVMRLVEFDCDGGPVLSRHRYRLVPDDEDVGCS